MAPQLVSRSHNLSKVFGPVEDASPLGQNLFRGTVVPVVNLVDVNQLGLVASAILKTSNARTGLSPGPKGLTEHVTSAATLLL